MIGGFSHCIWIMKGILQFLFFHNGICTSSFPFSYTMKLLRKIVQAFFMLADGIMPIGISPVPSQRPAPIACDGCYHARTVAGQKFLSMLPASCVFSCNKLGNFTFHIISRQKVKKIEFFENIKKFFKLHKKSHS